MEQLVAAIQKAEADAATLAKEIAQLDEDISVYEGDKKAATEVTACVFGLKIGRLHPLLRGSGHGCSSNLPATIIIVQ